MSPDQTGATRRALSEMYPAQWDDPYVAFCDECGRELDPTAAHSPHHPDCPQQAWGAEWCGCDRATCGGCCPDCAPPGEGATIALVALVLLVALLSIIWQGEPEREQRLCPDANGACVYQP